MLRKILTGAAVLGLAVSSVQAAQLGAYFNLNNNADDADANWNTVGTNAGIFRQMTNGNFFEDGYWDPTTDRLYPTYDEFDGPNGVLVGDGFVGGANGHVPPAPSFFGAYIDVSNLAGNNGQGGTNDNQWGSFAGSNLGGPYASGVTFAGGSLSIVGQANNGRYFDIMIDEDFAAAPGTKWQIDGISWASRGTSTGYNSRQISLILSDGSILPFAAGVGALPTTFGVTSFDFTTGSVTGLGGFTTIGTPVAEVVGVRVALNGASTSNGNHRFDNIVVTVSDYSVVVPEPSALGLAGVAGLGLLRRRRA